MEITGVECIVLGTPPRERRAADQTHEVALIRITADDGSSASARRRSRRPS